MELIVSIHVPPSWRGPGFQQNHSLPASVQWVIFSGSQGFSFEVQCLRCLSWEE